MHEERCEENAAVHSVDDLLHRPTLPAGAWWNRQQLLAVESLWAFTLQATLPCLEEQLWDQVPDLPHASAAVCYCITSSCREYDEAPNKTRAHKVPNVHSSNILECSCCVLCMTACPLASDRWSFSVRHRSLCAVMLLCNLETTGRT